ncbi:hypothetical protein HYY74_01030 [Candidatus Woesearchaeota archaeon]|nr:hypothetical protein [Candidatus Woesearchaeota archaeon]
MSLEQKLNGPNDFTVFGFLDRLALRLNSRIGNGFQEKTGLHIDNLTTAIGAVTIPSFGLYALNDPAGIIASSLQCAVFYATTVGFDLFLTNNSGFPEAGAKEILKRNQQYQLLPFYAFGSIGLFKGAGDFAYGLMTEDRDAQFRGAVNFAGGLFYLGAVTYHYLRNRCDFGPPKDPLRERIARSFAKVSQALGYMVPQPAPAYNSESR